MKNLGRLPFLLLGCWLLLLGLGSPLMVRAATEAVSVSTGGTGGNSGSSSGSIDATGRYVAFESTATSLVSNDTNNKRDVFLRDRQTGVTLRITGGMGGTEANQGSFGASISHDGRYIAYASDASNLVPNDTNGTTDVFLYDRKANKTTRVSVKNGGGQAEGGASFLPAISGDGRFIAYVSYANNLVANDTNAKGDLFLYDRQAKKTTRISVRSDGNEVFQEPGFSWTPSLSRDGRYIAYSSASGDLVDGDASAINDLTDIFVYDRQLKTTTLVSCNADGVQANKSSNSPSLSDDGTSVAFVSSASNLAGAGGQVQAYVKNLVTGAVTKVRPAATYSYSPYLNADGSRVALVTKVGAAFEQVEVVDLRTAQIFQPARFANGTDAGTSTFPSLSADGRVVLFETAVNNLASSDFNGVSDVFTRPLFDRIGFSKIADYVNEGNANASVTVTREGLLNGAVSVKYAISAAGDTAKPGTDYNPLPKTATLNWAAGDTSSRTITIPLVNTSAADGYRFFTVSLSNVTGGAVIEVPVTKVVIRDQESDPVENRIGHRLKFTKIVSRGTNWDTGLFRALFTIHNPASLPSFPGFIELQFDGNVLANLSFDSVPAKGDLVLDATASVGAFPDGDLVAILYESTDNGAIKQDSGFAAGYIDNGTAPPSGGTTQPNVGVKSGPPPVTVTNITIDGSGTVNEGTAADYSVTVSLSDGSTETNITPSWQASAFSINGAGRFTAGDVASNKTVTLTARVLRNGITTTKTRNITVNNVPAAPIITSDLTAFGSTAKSFQYRIEARHEPTSFNAINLPDGLTLNEATGVISGTPAVANTFNVTIQASNGANGGSTDTETLVLTISEPSPLTVNIVGTGTVSPDLNGELLDVGRPYKLTAKPGTDQLFSGWSNGVVSEAAAITFLMKPNLTLTATFVANPFLTRAGVYSGLVQSTPATHEGSGFFTVTLGKSGSCTGKVSLGGKSRNFKTVLKPNGTSPVVTLTKAGTDPIVFTLALDVVGNSGQITGNLTSGPLAGTIEARLKSADTSALAGRYTVLLPGPSSPSAAGDIPDGSGFATMNVNNKGTAKIAGALGDGTKWSQSAPIGVNNTCPIYVPLYSTGGSIFGPATFVSVAGSDLTAQLAWFKPIRPNDGLYPAGWPAGLTQALKAARYVPPPVLPALPAPDANGNVSLQITGGGLLGSLMQALNLNDNGSAERLEPVLQNFSFSVSASSGLFKGSFFDAGANTKRSFNGALYQKTPTGGAGVFKGASQRTGNVVLTPAP